MAELARTGTSNALPLAVSCLMANDSDTVLGVDRWLRAAFTYRPEEHEVLRTVPWMIQHGFEGDCDDMAIMGSAMLKALMIPARLTAIKPYNPDEFEHVFCEARVGTNWIPVDPTVPYGMGYWHFGMVHEYV